MLALLVQVVLSHKQSEAGVGVWTRFSAEVGSLQSCWPHLETTPGLRKSGAHTCGAARPWFRLSCVAMQTASACNSRLHARSVTLPEALKRVRRQPLPPARIQVGLRSALSQNRRML